MAQILPCDNDQMPAVAKVTDLGGENPQFLCPGCFGLYGLSMMVAAEIITQDQVERFYTLVQGGDGQQASAAPAKPARARKKAQPKDTASAATSTAPEPGGNCILRVDGCTGAATTTVAHPDSDPWPVCEHCAGVYLTNQSAAEVG